jgi:hypothetical protein
MLFGVFFKQRPLKIKKQIKKIKNNFEHFAKNPICNIKNNAGMEHPRPNDKPTKHLF